MTTLVWSSVWSHIVAGTLFRVQCRDVSTGQRVSTALTELHSCCERAPLGPLTDQGLWDRHKICIRPLCKQTLSRSVQCMMMMAREFGREKVCMCIYFQRRMLWGENNEKRETFLPPSLLQWHYTVTFISSTVQCKCTSFIRQDRWVKALNLLLEIRWWR